MNLTTYQSVNHRDEPGITAEIRDAILTAEANRPRSTQIHIGPSELGEPCLRRLAYKLMDHPQCNDTGTAAWASIIGTSVHATLADAFSQVNDRINRIRYLIEQRVEIRPGLTGTTDLYDFDHATVLDHKVVNTTALREYKLTGPGRKYRVQAHAYGTGIKQLGLPVEQVAIAFFPRASDLAQLHVWTEPYNPDIVTEALARHDTTIELICELNIDQHPDRYTLIPKTPTRLCAYCPWFKISTDVGVTCPGNITTGN